MAFTFSIFLSAFLLFIIQPLIAKKLLPLFGGSANVWLCNILFFQGVLLLGYLYSFFLTKVKRIATQLKIHGALLGVSLITLPIIPNENLIHLNLWTPLLILLVLTSAIGIPCVLISASSPLFQFWYNHCYQTAFPYRYYALSNFGSLLGLLAFPFILEPLLGLKIQFSLWSWLYVFFCISTLGCFRLITKNVIPLLEKEAKNTPLSWQGPFAWVGLAFLSNSLLLCLTQVMMQSVMSFPLLWVIPLSLYLITFILTFSAKRFYYRPLWFSLFLLSFALILYAPSQHQFLLAIQVLVYNVLLFSGCMILHGELVKRQPQKMHLVTFYLCIAAGGVLGGIFVNILAPLLFSQWWDFYLVLFSIALVIGYSILQSQSSTTQLFFASAWCASFVALSLFFGYQQNITQKDIIFHQRNFFGAMEIAETLPSPYRNGQRSLRHGNITHGTQFTQLGKRQLATSYYGDKSGIALSLDFQRLQNKEKKGLALAVIGLGTGTIAALAKERDHLCFYEIDPDVAFIANQYFSYLKDSLATTQVIIGDGRIALNQRIKDGASPYDVIAIDAFSGDAIPLHLLTLEALEVYLQQLHSDGILAFHISSRYIDLYPPLQALAMKLHLNAYVVYQTREQNGISASEWVLLSKNKTLGTYLFQKQALLFKQKRTDEIWTDDKSHLLSMIRW